MNDLTKVLLDNNELMSVTADNLTSTIEKLNELETKVNLIKAELTSANGIVNLPNQAQRDAAMEERLQTDPMHSDIYREYLTLKTEAKVAWIRWDLIKEQNSNVRTVLNSSTYSK